MIFFSFFLQTQNIDSLVEWLGTTPKTTSIRVNLLKRSTDDVKTLLLDALKENHPSYECPKISISKEFPEVILIENLKETNDLQAISGGKEIIVDVNCAASILRGMSPTFTIICHNYSPLSIRKEHICMLLVYSQWKRVPT